MDFTIEQLQQLSKILPPEILEAIKTFKFGFTVEEICGKHNLLISETDEVYQLVLKVVTGMSNPAAFEENLKKALPDQDEATVKLIVRDVDTEIFQKLKEHLVKAFEKKAPTDGTVGPEHREAILAEIEDPHLLPMIPPIIKPIEDKKPDILESKLQGTVPTTPQTTTITIPQTKLPTPEQKTETPPPAPKTYSKDPYREPIE